MQFSDIHIHALCGTDDGAPDAEYMYKMIDASYMDGIRYMCLTPHYNPGYFGENAAKSLDAFQLLQNYVQAKYSDMHLVLGNEIRYNSGCVEWLTSGNCRVMNDTKYVLVDFFENEDKKNISKGLDSLLNIGYIPILAHAERYIKLKDDLAFLKEQRGNGVLIQVDAGSILGDFGLCTRMFCRKILKNHLAHFVSSDAHSLKTRPPGIKKAYTYIEKLCGKSYADAVCFQNALTMIFKHSL